MEKKALIVSVFCCLLMISACMITGCAGNKLKNQIAEMQGMHIDMSFDNAIARYGDMDSTYSNAAGMKLVVFVDSMSCSSCFLNTLLKYNEINDSLQKHDASMVVIMHPQVSKLADVRSNLESQRFPFWCVIDRDGEFIRNNPDLPDNRLLHSFIIDKDDKVVLIGNPTTNPKINDLTIRLIREANL